ncbi:MAG: hypothetical protein RI988_40 [Pseudomonadota bacterium]|jgi:hypothetical protein
MPEHVDSGAFFDIFGRPGYTADKSREPMVVGGQLRDSCSCASLPVGEVSTHTLTETTRARQRLVARAQALIEADRLAAYVEQRHPERHAVRSERAL